MLGRFVEQFNRSDQKVRSARVKRGDGSIETHSVGYSNSLVLSLDHGLVKCVRLVDDKRPAEHLQKKKEAKSRAKISYEGLLWYVLNC